VECLGTDKCNPVGEEEALISCYGCGNSVHPSCRVYRCAAPRCRAGLPDFHDTIYQKGGKFYISHTIYQMAIK
jgi:hypothetical protein